MGRKSKYDKNWMVFFTGESSSGKSYFIDHFLPENKFYNLVSATTRKPRKETNDKGNIIKEEKDGVDYYFRDEPYFEREKFATFLWVNEHQWQPGTPKWLYGVPEFEILNNLGCNFAYAVIQPRYIRAMIDWFKKTEVQGFKLSDLYNFKILWFQPRQNSAAIIQQRQNMPNDALVRRTNTCNLEDFYAVDLIPDHKVICNPEQVYIDKKLKEFLQHVK